VNAQAFLELIDKGENLELADLKKAFKLQEKFPYFLAPKVIAAKYEWDNASAKSNTLLHWASVVSPDRKRLKSLLTGESPMIPESRSVETADNIAFTENGGEEAVENENPSKEASKETAADAPLSAEEQGVAAQPAADNISRPKRDEILRRLEENLKKIKKGNPKNQEASENLKIKDETEKAGKKDKPTNKDAGKSKKKTNPQQKKKKQEDLINNFSEKPIRLPKDKINESVDLPDLSTKSTVLNDHMLSESFAKLLVKQNKIAEAIEIYQKLILKFPKKRTYFADQIEKINK
jgi:hypothetical protein